MDARAFVRSGVGIAVGLALAFATAACGGDGATDPGNGNGNGEDAPTLSSLSPSSGEAGTTVSVTLTGTNFDGGNAEVNVSGSGVTVSNESVAGATSITADFEIAAGAAAGARSVTVSTDAGDSGSRTFTVEEEPTSGSLTVDATDGYIFDPDDATITTGTTVTWDNVGSETHNVTPDGHMEWTTATIEGGENFQHTFDTTGEYPYDCTIHAGMSGTITVVEP